MLFKSVSVKSKICVKVTVEADGKKTTVTIPG